MTKAFERKDKLTSSQAWQAALGELELQLAKPTFDVWLRPTRVLAYEDGFFTIGVHSAFARDWLENRLKRLIKQVLASVTDRQVDVRFVVQPKGGDAAPVEVLEGYAQPRQALNDANGRCRTLNPRFTFDTFVVGSSNRLPYAVCQAVSERPAETYNPLFIYGGVGLGKTHLLHAIGNHALERNLGVLYVSSEQFTNDLINAIRNQTTEEFRGKYRNPEILLIDDIQFIAGKESTQEEFFHTFNALHSANRQIVVSSDRPPKAISTLEARLRSRFEGGLIADIQPPDYEVRVAILHSKADALRVLVPRPIIEFIAQQVQNNIRELEGALNRVIAYSTTLAQPLSLEAAQHALKDLLTRKSHASPEAIVDIVAAYFGVRIEDLCGSSRKKDIVLPRQIAMYLLAESTDLSLPNIGALLGKRDHTTVLHGRDRVRELAEADVTIRRHLLALKEQIYQSTSTR
jgi:chromosomal replication initiator protein